MRYDQWLSGMCIVGILGCSGILQVTQYQEELINKTHPVYLPEINLAPVRRKEAQYVPAPLQLESISESERVYFVSVPEEPAISAESVYVVDTRSQTVLYEKNAHNSFSVASTAKLMTALVALDTFPLTQSVTVRLSHTIEGVRAGLLPGENIDVEQLLHMLLIQSANDAAVVLASNHPQGIPGFVKAMNVKAQELGLEGTHFTNPIGFDNPKQYATARDLAVLARECMKQPVLKRIVGKAQATVSNTAGTQHYVLQNTNAFVRQNDTVIGVKTGTTNQAGEALIVWTITPETELLSIVLGSNNRYLDTIRLLDWVVSWYQWQKIF